MNRKKIARLTAGIEGVEIRNTKEVLIAVYDEDGDLDRDATDAAKNAAQEALDWGGFSNQQGAWYLWENYRPIRGDWNDRMSEHHY